MKIINKYHKNQIIFFVNKCKLLIRPTTNSENKIGIMNRGNSCYINSIIQNLIHIPIFLRESLKNIEEIKTMPMSISYKFLNIYENLL